MGLKKSFHFLKIHKVVNQRVRGVEYGLGLGQEQASRIDLRLAATAPR